MFLLVPPPLSPALLRRPPPSLLRRPVDSSTLRDCFDICLILRLYLEESGRWVLLMLLLEGAIGLEQATDSFDDWVRYWAILARSVSYFNRDIL